jgi:eukaryotic-like serine/threonine-protein kinase
MLLGAVRAGDVLAEKYRVERILGAGGMGVVVAARHELLRERVAIKLLSPERTLNKSFVRRFLTEARSMVKLKNEHIVRVLDVGTIDGGIPYLVMDLLEGTDLACLIGEQGALPAQFAADYVRQACIGLAEAHRHGLVHRDLKPANLFLTKRLDGSPFVKVLDFGVAKRFDDSVEATKTGQLVGSPNYMAPEQVSSPSTVDARADVWALGVILYELIAGARPFAGSTVYEIFAVILHDTPKPLREHVPTIAPELEAVVARCLEKDRARRFESVDALRAALAPFATGASPSYVPASHPYGASPSPESTLLLSPSTMAAGAAFANTVVASSTALFANAPTPLPTSQRLSTPAPGPSPLGLTAPMQAPYSSAPPSYAPFVTPMPTPVPFGVTTPVLESPTSYPALPARSSSSLHGGAEPWPNGQQADPSQTWVGPLRAALVMAAFVLVFFTVRSLQPSAATRREAPPASTTPSLVVPPPNADVAQRSGPNKAHPATPAVTPPASPPKQVTSPVAPPGAVASAAPATPPRSPARPPANVDIKIGRPDPVAHVTPKAPSAERRTSEPPKATPQGGSSDILGQRQWN